MSTIRATVIGENEVAGAAPGETVELDSERVNISALIEGGHIELIKATDAKPNTAPSTSAPRAPQAASN